MRYFHETMTQKPIIIYDFKGKTQVQKVQILRKLYGYRDKSNYNYKYEREGEMRNIKFSREKKTVLKLENKKDLAKVVEILKEAHVKFEIGKI